VVKDKDCEKCKIELLTHVVNYVEANMKNWRKLLRNRAQPATTHNNAMATALLLEDCRHVMLAMPPDMFDKMVSMSPMWSNVVERLNNALSKDKDAVVH
jgi:hypothetical protein